MFRNRYAIGIGTGLGLILVHSNSASAQQQEIRQHQALPALHHHNAGHHQVAVKKDKEKDSKALTSLKSEVPDLRQHVAPVGASLHPLIDLKQPVLVSQPHPL